MKRILAWVYGDRQEGKTKKRTAVTRMLLLAAVVVLAWVYVVVAR